MYSKKETKKKKDRSISVSDNDSISTNRYLSEVNEFPLNNYSILSKIDTTIQKYFMQTYYGSEPSDF